MIKGAKIGIGIGVVVALGVASYFLFFKNKGEKGKEKDNDSDSSDDGFSTTEYMTTMDSMGKSAETGGKWVYLKIRPKKGKVLKTDTVVISGTAKFDNEYPIENLWHDKNGDLGAVRISKEDLPDSVYKLVIPKGEKRDRTFEDFGKLTFKRKEGASAIGGCGCGAV